MTNEQHNRYISWAFIAYGAFLLIFVLTIFSLVFFVEPPPGSKRSAEPPPAMLVGFMITFFSVFILLFAAPSIVAAYTMKRKKPWARIAALIAGGIAAMNVPIGTAVCAYSFWFFLSDNWKEIYTNCDDKNSSTRAAQLSEIDILRWEPSKKDETGENK